MRAQHSLSGSLSRSRPQSRPACALLGALALAVVGVPLAAGPASADVLPLPSPVASVLAPVTSLLPTASPTPTTSPLPALSPAPLPAPLPVASPAPQPSSGGSAPKSSGASLPLTRGTGRVDSAAAQAPAALPAAAAPGAGTAALDALTGAAAMPYGLSGAVPATVPGPQLALAAPQPQLAVPHLAPAPALATRTGQDRPDGLPTTAVVLAGLCLAGAAAGHVLVRRPTS